MNRFIARLAFVAAAVVSVLAAAIAAAADRNTPHLTLNKGDRICLIGNTLGERMQLFNHFETLLHSQYPQHQLTVRNKCWSADELYLRPRSDNFGSPDEHLKRVKADVVVCLFGFNESFAGEEGLPKFKENLKKLIGHMQGQRYNDAGSPRLAFISPVAHEDLGNPNLPDGKTNNANIALYTAAMAEVCGELNVPLADVFSPTRALFADPDTQHTMNGVHLNDAGYRELAPILFQRLFDEAVKYDADALGNLRAEIAEKNFQFWHRYRAVNGYYIYGGRSKLWNNRNVMERERLILDEMCANRDERIWAVAQGKSVPEEVDDSNVSPFLEVNSNYKRPIEYLSPEQAKEKFKLADGYQVNCFASEDDFPELANPTQMAIDAQGRVWVTVMPSYPQYQPGEKLDDKVLILEDRDGDGKADKCTTFAGGLHLPTGIELGDGGAYVAAQPNLIFLKDTDGDDQADREEVVLHGFDSADSHHSISAFTWGNGGALYFQEGTFHHSQTETPWGPKRVKNAGVFRYEPRSEKLDIFVSYGFANPWGHVFDRWGQNFVADASGGANYYGAAFSGHIDYPDKHAGLKHFLKKQYRPTAGCELVSSRHFPKEVQGNYLLNNCIGFQGVAQYKIKDEGSGFHADPVEVLLQSSDTNFRPVDLEFGADGALYIVDWHNALIGHMQHSIRDPKRDTKHGRIWRVTYKDRSLVEPAQIAGQPVEKLLDLLKAYEDRTRYRVRRELRKHPTDKVVPAVEKWLAGLDESDDDYEHHRLEALWVLQHHNVVNEDLLQALLRSDDYRARAAATRVLCYWRDRLEDPLGLLQKQVNDQHPRVRLEAIRALSFFEGKRGAKAYEIALESLAYPQDDYLKYTLNETSKTLDKYWKAGAE